MSSMSCKECKIDIAVCLDKGFVMPTGVMMYSVCVNNQDVDIDFHVLIDESVTDEDQQDLKDIANKFSGKKVHYYTIERQSSISFPLKLNHVTQSTYYRLFLSDILPSTIEKVLYLDGDLIVRHSLLPLWHTDINDYAVGAAKDVVDRDVRIYNRLSYPQEKGYFNAGVLLINLKYWRDNDITKDCIRYIHDYPDRILYVDQDVLNVVLQDKKLIIPIKYNIQAGFLKKFPFCDKWENDPEVNIGMKDPVIVHFTERWKPWYIDLPFFHPYRSTFLKYQKQTKWKNYFYDRRSLYMKMRNGIGDILRKMGIKKQKNTRFLNIPPID